MTIIGLDPGSTESSMVEIDRTGAVITWMTTKNASIREALRDDDASGVDTVLAVEWMRPRGMPTSQEEIDTCVELGRMVEAWLHGHPERRLEAVSRMQEKMHVCGRANATDANIRQALIDLYGGEAAIGGKKCPRCGGKGWRGPGRPKCDACAGGGWRVPPGPLRGLAGDEWAALAIAVTARERLNGNGTAKGYLRAQSA